MRECWLFSWQTASLTFQDEELLLLLRVLIIPMCSHPASLGLQFRNLITYLGCVVSTALVRMQVTIYRKYKAGRLGGAPEAEPGLLLALYVGEESQSSSFGDVSVSLQQ